MAKVEIFNTHLHKYEQWFIENEAAFISEVNAIKEVLPTTEKIIEVGIGSGLFAEKLGIREGCDPSLEMRKKATQRGISAIEGIAENLPYADESIDCILMVTTICFVDNVDRTFQELHRVLKNNGFLIMAFVDKNSDIGKTYQAKKEESLFYKDAVFYSTEEIYKYLWGNNFEIIKTVQTLFGRKDELNDVQEPLNGSGKGSFIVVKSKKNKSTF